ncbi:MAG: hypothetical protein R3272_01370 [Candidatus Promineifilaceae bacterium]|nr:hypothetical protein [Candidatus Promineifilaceae bacterium]
MTGFASGLVLSFFLATAYGAAFHVILGGPARRILLYVLSAWVGFTLGHFVGEMLDVELLTLGAINLFSASLGTWIALIASWLLTRNQ